MRKKVRDLPLQPKYYIIELIVAVAVALVVSLLLVLLCSFLVTMFNIPVDIVPIITCGIKVISIVIGGLICLRRPKNGWIRGALFGICYVLLSFVLFSLLGGSFEFGLKLLNDVALGTVCGAVTGIIAVNVIRH